MKKKGIILFALTIFALSVFAQENKKIRGYLWDERS